MNREDREGDVLVRVNEVGLIESPVGTPRDEVERVLGHGVVWMDSDGETNLWMPLANVSPEVAR